MKYVAIVVGIKIESQNHNMFWIERDLKDHLVPTPLP